MKEKIEKLIKEVGINEVENILQEMKSKVNVKEELKKDFIDLLNGCTILFDGVFIDYNKENDRICHYRKDYNYLTLRNKYWSYLQSKYKINYQELKSLLKSIVEDVLGYKGVDVE